MSTPSEKTIQVLEQVVKAPIRGQSAEERLPQWEVGTFPARNDEEKA